MRSGGGAAVGVVTEGVDVEASLGVGVVASDVPGDLGRGGLVLLLEGNGTGDLGVTTDDSNCRAARLAQLFNDTTCHWNVLDPAARPSRDLIVTPTNIGLSPSR